MLAVLPAEMETKMETKITILNSLESRSKVCARYLNMRYLSQYLDLKLQIDSARIGISADDCIIYLKYIYSAIEVT